MWGSKVFHWTKITREEISALSMTAESAVYFTLKMFMGTNGVAYPSASTLSEVTGYSVKMVRRATKSLKEKGLLVRDGFDSRSQTARYKLGDESGVPQKRGTPLPQERGTPPTPNMSPNREIRNIENNNRDGGAAGPALDGFIFAGLQRID